MNDTLEIPRGATACLTKAGLALGDGAKTGVALVSPVGAGIDFVINGQAYHKADAATNLPLSAATVQPVLTTCMYLICVDSSLAVTSVQGTPVLTADLTAGKAVLDIPEPTANTCPIGAVKVACANAATFTPGTTALDATDITETYYDYALGLPSRPRTS
jgi:hypothetical protein